MLIHTGLLAECLRCLALGFVAPVSWEWSTERREATQRTWRWVLLFAVMALFQIAMLAIHPDLSAEAYRLM
jgi:hypothetical protein